MPHIIGFYSPTQGCGKTTLAQSVAHALVDKHKTVRMISFADALREEAITHLKCSYLMPEELAKMVVTDMKDDTVYAGGMRVCGREILKELGKKRRDQDEQYWVGAVLSEMNDLPADAFVIVDDVRFYNEYLFCKTRGIMVDIATCFNPHYREPKEVCEISEGNLNGLRFDCTITDQTISEATHKILEKLPS